MGKIQFNEAALPSSLIEGAFVVVNGVTYIGDENNLPVLFVNLISVTYAELATLVSSNGLFSGAKYLITDYKTTYTQDVSGVSKEGSIEPLIVTATTTSSLHSLAISTIYPSDVIWYDVNNDENKVPGATKGCIYRRIDEAGNDLPIDFREVKYRRYAVTAAAYDVGTTYARKAIVSSGGALYASLWAGNIGNAVTDADWWLELIVTDGQKVSPITTTWNGLTVDVDDYEDYLIFQDEAENNVIGGDSVTSEVNSNLTTCNNVFFGTAGGNRINGVTYYNTFLGDTLNNNIFVARNNVIGDGFNDNWLQNGFQLNIIGSIFKENISAPSFKNGQIGNNFYRNTVSSIFDGNVVANGFIGNFIDFRTVNESFRSQTQLMSNTTPVQVQVASGGGTVIRYITGTTETIAALEGAP